MEFLSGDSQLVGFGAQQVPGFPAGLKVSLCSPPFNAVKIQASPQTLFKLSKDGFDPTLATTHLMLLAVSYSFILILIHPHFFFFLLFFYSIIVCFSVWALKKFMDSPDLYRGGATYSLEDLQKDYKGDCKKAD